MKSQLNLIIFAILVVSLITITIFVSFSSISYSSEKKLQINLDKYANIVYRSVLSPSCLGDFYHPLGHVNTTKLNYFLSKYTNSFLPCIKSPLYAYSVEIDCEGTSYYLGIQFPEETFCEEKVFPGELNTKLCNITVKICADSYSRLLAFLYSNCEDTINSNTNFIKNETFLFSKEVTFVSGSLCENGICNKVYCKRPIDFLSRDFYGMFKVFFIYNSTAGKVTLV
jgi:hypothetical protein